MLILAAASALAALAWLYLLTCHGGYWLTGQRLPPVSTAPATWPPVTAVVATATRVIRFVPRIPYSLLAR